MNETNEIILFLQANWQWIFALACFGLYFYDKNKTGSSEPKSKLASIGKKAEELLDKKADEFIEKVEDEALDALAEKVDSLDEAAVEVLKEAIELVEELAEAPAEPPKSEWHKPNMSEYDMSLEDDKAQFESDLAAFMKKLKDAGYEFTELGGYPNPSRAAKTRKCPCGSGNTYKKCHAPQWIPNPE